MFRALNDRTASDGLSETVLRQAFWLLPARWRQAIWTVDVLGCRGAELASALGIDHAAASSLLFRARTALKTRIDELEDAR